MTDTTLTIRRADLADSGALVRLAALDSASPPTGESLIAEVGQEVWAAVEIDSGAAIADPFRPSADVVELLRFRAERMRSAEAARRRRRLRLLARAPRLLPRSSGTRAGPRSARRSPRPATRA